MTNPISLKSLRDTLDEHAIVSATDAVGNIIHVNQKFIDISGYSRQELLGKNHRILKSGIHTASFYQDMWDTLQSGNTWQGEVCNRRKDGCLYWVRATIKPTLDDHGLPYQYISIRTDITEMKRTEENIRRNQLLMRSVIDAIPDLIFFKDNKGKYLGCNAAFERYFGSPEALIAGKTDFDFVDQKTAAFFREQDALMLASGKPRTNEEYITYPDGHKAMMEVVKIPYHYGGESPGVIGIGHDITQRKEKLQALHESEERWAFAVEGAGDGVWDWDMKTGRMLLSRLYEEMLGFSKGELAQNIEGWSKSVHPEDAARIQQQLQDYLTGKTPIYAVELRMRCKDGRYKWILCRGKVVERDEEYNPIRMIGIHSDINERKQAERQLDLFREMIENTGQPIFMIDVEDKYRLDYVNQAAVDHWGAPREELLKWRIPDWDPNFDEQRTARHFVEMVGKPGVLIETEHRLKSGQLVPVEVFVNARIISGKPYIFGSFQNISARRKSEEALYRAKETAEKANRAKSDFLSNMSHELRTPMNAILGFSQLLEGDSTCTPDQKENVQQISRAGWHLLDLINEVLDLASVESGEIKLELEDIDPADIVRECLSLVSPLIAQRQINVTNLVDGNLPRINADYLRIKQVLINLLSNAIKYNREAGTVTVDARVENNMLTFSVRDSGMGMTEKQLQNLFQPFTRFGDTEKVQGTGIGLSISKKLIEKMNGKIVVESKLGEGSIFSVMMPQSRENTDISAVQGTSYSLLSIQDDVSQKSLLSKWAGNKGWQITFAQDASSGIEAAMTANYDAILLDIKLPGGFSGMDVKAVLDEMESLRTIPVIGIGSHEQQKEVNRAMQAGFSSYLGKPVDLMELERVIQQAVRGGGNK